MRRTNIRLTAMALTGLWVGTAVGQQNWQLQQTLIQTRWAAQVTPDNALKEYPRPQLERKQWQNLNGLWDYAIVKKESQIPSKYDGKILVPYPAESALSGVKRSVQPEQEIWYRRSFEVKSKNSKVKSHSSDHTLLHFGAVDYEATVYVNGQQVGKHEGGYTEFSFDVTQFLKNGSNELAVKVWDPTDKGIGPHGKQVLNPSSIYYTPSSGIWQTVWLETVPEVYIKDLKLTPDVDQSALSVDVNFAGNCEGCQVEIEGAGKKRAEILTSSSVVLRMTVEQPHLWSPDDPYLYDLIVRIKKGKKTIDEVKSYFGMRKISVMKDEKGIERIALNNKPYYNLGVLDQGFWPEGLYTAPTDEALAFDIKASKAMGFNTIRKHIKVEPARWYYWADKLGILVWQDMVNPNQSLPEGSKAEFEKESAEILGQLKNHPSITTWVLFNEKWGQYDQERLTKWIKDTDPTRLVNGHSGEYLYVNKELRSPSPNAYVNADITDVHSYPNPMMPEKQPGKAQVLGEFGGIGVSIEGHLFDDTKAGWGYDGTVTPSTMQKQYTTMTDSLVKLKEQGLSGSIYTQPYDVETEQNGLMTYDRAFIKLPVETFRKINAKVWPATANYVQATKGFSTNVADTTVLTFEQRLEQYNAGKRDSAFLRSFALMSNKEHPVEAKKAADDYIQSIRAPFQEANMNFLVTFTHTPADPGYQLIKSHPSEVKAMINNGIAPLQIWNLIYPAEVQPLITPTPDWTKIHQVLSAYPRQGQEYLYYSILNSYMAAFGQKAPNALENLYTALIHFDEGYGIKGGMLNQVAWFFFENVNDKAMLEKAVAWSKRSIDADPNNPYQMDTYANLLHKLGRTEEAIEWEERALKLLPGDAGLSDTLEKMKNGVKTWKEQ